MGYCEKFCGKYGDYLYLLFRVLVGAMFALHGGQKLFGSVKTTQFTDALAILGHEIDKRFVKLSTIKELGKYEAEIRLHRNVTVTVPFEVIAE